MKKLRVKFSHLTSKKLVVKKIELSNQQLKAIKGGFIIDDDFNGA